MDVSTIGEFELIRRITAILERAGVAGGGWGVIGIGDDAAVLPGDGYDLLLAVDMMVAGTHFYWPETGGRRLGHKALAVNLSDIAAMGGEPVAAFVSLALPGDTEMEDVEGIYAGLADLAARHGLLILGGDTVRAPQIAVSITVIGRVDKGRALLRRGAWPGECLYVSGSLGLSAAGLAVLRAGREAQNLKLENGALQAAAQRAVIRHLMPSPRLALGRLLCERGFASCCIDISDSLASEVRHICQASGVGALVELARIPVDNDARTLASAFGVDAAQWALRGGEDYELLFTCPAESARDLEQAVTQAGLSQPRYIGEITAEEGVWLVTKGGKRPLGGAAYGHFGAPGD